VTSDHDKVKSALEAANRVFVLTGAGVSAESGVPTFRDAQSGVWDNYDPQQLASPEGFARDPELVWSWYASRINQLESTVPNAGHEAIASLEASVPEFFLLTQNVDGLHQVAGSKSVHEIHGNIWRQRCTVSEKIFERGVLSLNPPYPIKSPEGHLVRPDVVWFGETIRMDTYFEADEFIEAKYPDVCMVVGTTGLFPYIQEWVLQCARSPSTLVVEVNPTPSVLAQICDVVLAEKAGEALPKIIPN